MADRSLLGRLLGALRGEAAAGELRFRLVPPNAADDPFPFVHVEEDGSARELDAAERAYLREEFHPADGGRPYVKGSYGARTPDGKLWGYLRREQLPAHVAVRPAPSADAEDHA